MYPVSILYILSIFPHTCTHIQTSLQPVAMVGEYVCTYMCVCVLAKLHVTFSLHLHVALCVYFAETEYTVAENNTELPVCLISSGQLDEMASVTLTSIANDSATGVQYKAYCR